MSGYEGIVGIVLFFILIVLGVRIAFSAMIAGLVAFLLVYGDLNTAGIAMAGKLFTESSNYSYTVIPLFVLMGYLAQQYGIGSDIFTTARAWIGRLRGGLAMSSVMGCAFFGAMCGFSPVAVALFGKVAVPEMEKSGYDWKLSLGSIAAAGALADLIPPSTTMVIYAMLAQVSLGKLLVAGFIPGIITAIAFCILIFVLCLINPKLGPPGPSSTFREKIVSLKGIIVIVIVLVIIIGGLYSGIFTPTEAAAWSALVMLFAGFISKRGIKPHLLNAALKDTAITSCMVFMIIIGVTLMSTALISSGAIQNMIDFFQSVNLNKYMLMLIAIAIYLVLGCFVGVLGMLVMTVPFLIPILQAAGWDPILLGILVVVFVEIGLITPPVGMNVYVIATVTGRDVGKCFQTIIPFLIVQLVLVGLFIACPAIITFIPSHM